MKRRLIDLFTQRWVIILVALLLLGGAMGSLPYGHLHSHGNVPPFLLGMVFMCIGFLLALKVRPVSFIWFWGLAIATRLILLPMEPSDDIYRYIWEGRVQNLGFNPYLNAPNNPVFQPFHDRLWESVEHKGIGAIYPPLAELGFRALAAMRGSILGFKLAFTLADLVVCGLLAFRFGRSSATLYAWNPLVLYSFAGGGHYDSWFILSIVASWMAWDLLTPSRRAPATAVLLGMGVALKWMCLPLLVWLVWRTLRDEGWKRSLVTATLGIIPFATAWAIICAGSWNWRLMPKDYVIYARSADLLPSLLAGVWPGSLSHNELFLIPLAVVCVLIYWRASNIFTAFEWFFAGLLVLSPVIHAWYFTWMIPFAVKSRNRGVIAVSCSAFVYFWLYHRIEALNGEWLQTPFEQVLMWGPFVVGFLISQLHPWKKLLPSA